jgi:hypothetical protein
VEFTDVNSDLAAKQRALLDKERNTEEAQRQACTALARAEVASAAAARSVERAQLHENATADAMRMAHEQSQWQLSTARDTAIEMIEDHHAVVAAAQEEAAMQMSQLAMLCGAAVGHVAQRARAAVMKSDAAVARAITASRGALDQTSIAALWSQHRELLAESMAACRHASDGRTVYCLATFPAWHQQDRVNAMTCLREVAYLTAAARNLEQQQVRMFAQLSQLGANGYCWPPPREVAVRLALCIEVGLLIGEQLTAADAHVDDEQGVWDILNAGADGMEDLEWGDNVPPGIGVLVRGKMFDFADYLAE